MFRLGLRLTLRSGREAFVRLLLTTVAVAVGVVVLLSVLADYHAYQAVSLRQSWESTSGIQGQLSNTSNVELWNYSENIYKGQFLEQLGVAALGPNAPILPGISSLPKAGQFYASPALAALLKTVPSDELGNRFPGIQIGTIGQKALSFPTELAVFIGYSPDQLRNLPNTIAVNQISSGIQLQGTTNIYRDAFGIGAIAILFPLLILINTATRLAASRREDRYATMRLVGATTRQVSLVASVDAAISALFGAIVGIAAFLVIRPALAKVSFSGVKFFANTVTPTVWGYLLMLIGVPILATLASLISLRRVQISPLGVSRKTTPPPPRLWRLTPLVIGIPLFIFAAKRVSNNAANSGPGLLFIGFFLILVGLILSGSWLTMQLSKILAKYARGASSLLAARRLADNPKVAFRSVSGLVLAVFVGSVVAVVAPAINAAQKPISDTSLTNVLRVSQGGSLSAADSVSLIHKLNGFSGTNVIPIYTNPEFIAFTNAQPQEQGNPAGGNIVKAHSPGDTANPPDDSIISCASLKLLPVLGHCPAGANAITVNAQQLLGDDNPLFINKSVPLVDNSSLPASIDTNVLQLNGMLIKTNNADTLEKVRTFLATYQATISTPSLKPGSGGGPDLTAWQMGELEPETFGEVAQIRNNDDTNVERVVLAAVALTILIAGCSLAVTVGGSLVERKRPFTLLRLSGSPITVLYRVIILEAALPLLVASLAAAAIGIGVATPVINALLTSLAPTAKYAAHPGVIYYVTVASGLLVSLALIIMTLPLLKRITTPEEARFE